MNSSAAMRSEALPPLNVLKLGSSGPVLVMLHGWGRSLEALRPLGELLATKYRIVLIDLPGFGDSPLPVAASNDGGGWSTADYSERIHAWLEEAGISRCILVGHSFGGRVSVRLSARYPKLVQALILIGSHGLKRERPFKQELRVAFIKGLVSLAKSIDGVFGSRLFKHYLAPHFGSTDYRAAGELRKTLVKTVSEDLSSEAQSIDIPTLLLWGEDDTATPLDLARSFHRLIRNSQLHIFPHKGHEPFEDAGAHLVANYIERFLSEQVTCAD